MVDLSRTEGSAESEASPQDYSAVDLFQVCRLTEACHQDSGAASVDSLAAKTGATQSITVCEGDRAIELGTPSKYAREKEFPMFASKGRMRTWGTVGSRMQLRRSERTLRSDEKG